MEQLMEELIDILRRSSRFSFLDSLSLLSVIAAWITIWFLLKERAESNRPYLQITFELVRSSMVCLVMRNVGNTPLRVTNLVFDRFIEQLNDKDCERLENNGINDLRIFPDKQWVISFGVITSDVINKFSNKIVNVECTYSKINKRKKYSEKFCIDFEQYKPFMVYISEIDELRAESKKASNKLENIDKRISILSEKTIEYYNMTDSWIKRIKEDTND